MISENGRINAIPMRSLEEIVLEHWVFDNLSLAFDLKFLWVQEVRHDQYFLVVSASCYTSKSNAPRRLCSAEPIIYTDPSASCTFNSFSIH